MTLEKVFPDQDIVNNPDIIEAIKEIEVEAVVNGKGKYQNRLDQVAYEYLKDPQLWWVIAIFNDIIDPMTTEIEQIKVPSLDGTLEALRPYDI